MGQHKYNPNAKLAAEGKIQPKTPPLGKRESERILMGEMTRLFYEKLYPGLLLEERRIKNG
jgi:hypothetical protein